MLIIVISCISVLLIASGGYLYYDLKAFKTKLGQELAIEAQVIGSNSEAALTFSDQLSASEILQALRSRSEIESAAIYEKGGRQFATYSRSDKKLAALPKSIPEDGVYADSTGISAFHTIKSKNEIVGKLYLRSTLQEWVSRRNSFIQTMLILTLVCVLISSLIGYRLQKIISAPILELTEAVRFASREKKYDFEIARTTRDEVGELVDGFNLMFKQIGARDVALQHANDSLEMRVQMRTAELEQEILDRTEAEELLAKSERALSDFFDNATVGLHWVSSNGIILRANRAELHMLGYTKEEYVGRNIREFHVDKVVIDGLLDRLLDGEDISNFEARMRCKDGHVKDVLIDSSMFVENDHFVHSRCFTRDISAEKQAAKAKGEQERVEQANAAKNEFLSRTSHELRTPMNAIMGFSQLLEMDDLSDNQRDSVERILSASQHLLKIIDDVLDISKIESGNLTISLEPIRISDIINSSLYFVRFAAEQKNVTIHVNLPQEEDVFVLADRQRLIQVAINLLSNAVKYNVEDGEVFVEIQKFGSYQRIMVTDTGRGIPADKISRIFTPFERLGAEQTSIEGTGLGLALSKKLCETMNAKIGVLPTDKGACFHVDLLEVDDSKEILSRERVEAYCGLQENGATLATILTIEDNPSNNRLMEKVLKLRPGIRLFVADQGEIAMELAIEHRPDVILLDLNLPGIQGEEVLEMLKANRQTKNIPIIVVSADVTPSKIKTLKKAGISDFITKPVNVPALLKSIESCLKNEERLSA